MGWGSAIGGIGGGIASAKAADKAMKRQIEWERERATHAHQWEVEDLKAAGLNPILSAGGSGAVTGGISAAMPDFSGLQGLGSEMSAESQAKTAKKQQQAQEKLQTQQVKQSEQQTENLKMENEILGARAQEANANAATTVLEQKMRRQYLKNPVGYWTHQVGQGAADLGGPLVGGVVGFGTRGMLNPIKGTKGKPILDLQKGKFINKRTSAEGFYDIMTGKYVHH